MIGYVTSPAVREEFEARLGDSIGGKAHIGAVICGITGYVKLVDVQLDTTPKSLLQPSFTLKLRDVTLPWRWVDVVATNRLIITHISVTGAHLFVHSPSSATILPGQGLPAWAETTQPGAQPLAADGAVQPPGSSLGWLFQPENISVFDGSITFQEGQKATWAELSGINAAAEQNDGTINLYTCTADKLTITHGPFVFSDIHFPLSVTSSGQIEVKNWVAQTVFGKVSGSVETVNGEPQVTIHSSGASLDKLFQVFGFPALNLLDEQGAAPLSFDSQWDGINEGHLVATGQAKISESHFHSIPAQLQPLTAISKTLDPISLRTEFTAKLDLAGAFQSQASLTNLSIQLGLPDYAEPPPTPAPAPHPRHAASATPTPLPTPTPAPPSAPQELSATGWMKIDFAAETLSGLLTAPIQSPNLAAQLSKAMSAKPKITNLWTIQLLSDDQWKSLSLKSSPPTPTPVPSPAVTPSPSPAPSPVRRRHHHG
jgi:hypothetical protein